MATADVGEAEKKGKLRAHRLQCVVVTPERIVFDELADFVALTLYDGELGVLPGRAPLIGRLGFGELRTREGGRSQRYFVDGGFVQIRDNVITVLTQRATPAASVDSSAAARELEQAQSRAAVTDHELEQKAKAIDRARAQIRVAAHRG
jgi:F-type H+-transporting ATPase subunit epsilon